MNHHTELSWSGLRLNGLRSGIKQLLLAYRRAVVICTQVVLIIFSFFLAFALRFDFQIPPNEIELIVKTLPMLLICRLVWFYVYRLFSGWWQYAGISDLMDILKATFFSSVSCVLAVVFLFNMRGFPRSVFIIDWILIFLLMAGLRLSARLYKERIRSRKNHGRPKDVLIAGAGDAGVMLYNEIRNNPHLRLRAIGFVDDNKRKKGAKIRGLTVMGTCKDIGSLVEISYRRGNCCHSLCFQEGIEQNLQGVPESQSCLQDPTSIGEASRGAPLCRTTS